MIKYTFVIDKFPKKITGLSDLECFTESEQFSISVDGLEVFNEPEFFVCELFSALHRWLIDNPNGESDFYFTSMDYEEEPVVAFSNDEVSGKYRFESELKLADATVSFQDIVDSYQQFKTDLSAQLLKKYKYSFKAKKIREILNG